MTDRERLERKAFLKAIADDPTNEVNRRVYGDWLEEHGLDDDAQVQRDWTPSAHADASRTIDYYASRYDMEMQDLIDDVTSYVERIDSGEGDQEGLYYVNSSSGESSNDFWEAYQVYTGRLILPLQYHVSFSCAC